MSVFDNLSIVVPVGPEDSAWHYLLKELQVFGSNVDIILSACQAQPASMVLPSNVKWLQSQQGRANQLNVGAERASRNIIWFLHADSRFTPGVKDAMCSFIKTEDQAMGYFKLKFANDGPEQTRLNAWAANIRSRYFGLPFGDQGFVMNKSIFEQLNGFDETISMGEDLDFVIRLQSAGYLLHELSAELITSSRRYQQQGWLSTTARHIWLTWCLTRQAKHRLIQP